MTTTNALLQRSVPKPTRRHARRSELGADPLAADYDRGPFAAAHVPDFPSHLVRLVERAAGRPFDAALFAHYERARAYTGYPGIDVTPDLGARQTLLDPREDPPPPTSAGNRGATLVDGKRPIATALPRAGVNPHDLGD